MTSRPEKAGDALDLACTGVKLIKNPPRNFADLAGAFVQVPTPNHPDLKRVQDVLGTIETLRNTARKAQYCEYWPSQSAAADQEGEAKFRAVRATSRRCTAPRARPFRAKTACLGWRNGDSLCRGRIFGTVLEQNACLRSLILNGGTRP
ncbi:MAG: hypothetical protein HYY13_11110 [Nitrospirae bacterium]|nr:hypothetical protein [Nitrospirota bacterium]